MNKSIPFLLVYLLLANVLWAQLTLKVVSVPENTPADASVYVAGTFNNWNPGDENYKLSMNQEGHYQIVLDIEAGVIKFKFTRGSWETVEGNASGGFLPDRMLEYSGGEQTAELEILTWEDLAGSGGNSTAADNVMIIDENFYIPQLDRNRRIWLYLPPDYESSGKSYPVLYMHDGQNVFDAATSFAGEWEVDESLNSLFEEGDEGIIVVAIDNGGSHRIDEYSPWENPNYGGGEGEAYVSFIIETLKPYIDENYRTLPEREHTGIMGSSMGGLISLYAATEHQEVFGKAGVFSPSLWFSPEVFNHVSATGKEQNMRIYMLIGEQEGGSAVNNVLAMNTTLLNAGFTEEELFTITHPDGAHSEWYWAREFPDAYEWLFDENMPAAVTNLPAVVKVRLVPNPADSILYLESDGEITDPEVQIFTIDGKIISPKSPIQGHKVDTDFLENGLYILNIFSGDQLIASQKLVIKK